MKKKSFVRKTAPPIFFVVSIICRTFVFKLKTNNNKMSTTIANIGKSHMGFRFRNDLATIIRAEARKENRSLNNFMENLLIQHFSVEKKVPKATTIAAIEEAKVGNLETLDVDF